jgi:hypothetical protein
MSRLTILARFAALIAIGLALEACAGGSSPRIPASADFNAAAYRSRIESIISQWDSRGGSSIQPPAGWNRRVPGEAAVSAAWWGFNDRDSAGSLQAALDSGVQVVLVPKMPTPWIITRTLHFRSGGVELLLEPGVEIVAAEGAFRGGGDSLIEADGVADFSILGYGATLRMRKRDYQKAPYEKAEWRHAISLRGVARARIAGLRIESSGGDGIYVGTLRTHEARQPCEDLTLQDLEIHDSLRQGVSVISARRLVIENCLIAGTSGAHPMSGIDFEPNSGDPGFTDCVVRGCRIERNGGVGLLLVLSKLGQEAAPVSVRVQDCEIDNFPIAVWLHGLENRVRGNLTFSGNTVRGMQLLRGSSYFSVVFARKP